MKRYDSAVPGGFMRENPTDGDYVKYEDAQKQKRLLNEKSSFKELRAKIVKEIGKNEGRISYKGALHRVLDQLDYVMIDGKDMQDLEFSIISAIIINFEERKALNFCDKLVTDLVYKE